MEHEISECSDQHHVMGDHWCSRLRVKRPVVGPINSNFANKGPLLWLFWKGRKFNPNWTQEGYRSKHTMYASSSHFALGGVCAGHPCVGDDFLPLAVLVEPAGGYAKERGYHKLSSLTWSLQGISASVTSALCSYDPFCVYSKFPLTNHAPSARHQPRQSAETSTTEKNNTRYSCLQVYTP